MGLANCAKCCDVPCRCGHDYQSWSDKDLADQIEMLQKVFQQRNGAASTKHVRVGVAVVISRPGGEILVGKRKGSHGVGTWTVPGGHLEMGESIEQCARREVLEETGMTLGAVSWGFDVTNDIFSEDKHYITIWVHAVTLEGSVPVNMEPDKCEGWEWHDRHYIPKPHFLGLENLIKQQPMYFSRYD